MEKSPWNWELVGDLANTAQLTGLDIPKIVGLIIRAASSPRILKQRVLKFGQHVKDIMDLLKALDLKAMMENDGTRNILHRLEEVLKKSYILVDKCKNKGYVYLFRKGLTLSQAFKQAQAEIDECLRIIPLMVLREFQLFQEHYVNAREEEECKKKLAAIYIFNFKQLLDEAAGDITDKTDYEYFAKKWGHDERFKNLDHIQRISLFNERKGKTRQAIHIASFKAMPGNSSSERSKGNPRNVHLLVGELLDGIVGEPLDEDFIEDLIMSAGDSLSVNEQLIEQLIEECEKRNQLRLLKPILEQLVSEGSQDVHVHSALSKVINIDTNDNPEHFLTANPYYDSYVGNPSNFHLLVGELLDYRVGEPLDDGDLENFIQDMIMSVGDSLPVKQLIEECEKRNRLRLLKPILEHLVSEGSQDVHVHNALGKVIIDTNDNPEHFLTKNPYYDSDVVGKYCERRDPTLAVVAYRRAKLDDRLIDVTNKNNLFKLQARYVVERADPQIWKTVLALENPFRWKLIYQVVCSALPESNDSYQISATVKAFINVDRPHELIKHLEKVVLQNSTFSGNPNLQYLLIRTAIEADRSRLMTYINIFDNFNGSEIGMIAVRKRLYEEAFHIFKKFNLNVQAVDVLLNHIRSIERAVEFASCVEEDAVWSHLEKAQL